MTAPLTLGDIADVRAYERERPAFRATVIDLKKRRRVPLGPVVSVLFEHRDTVRFQIQEMIRAERIVTDDAVQRELDAYNPLLPGAGRWCATVFVELTTPEEARDWLPVLVGIERHVVLRLSSGEELRGAPDDADAARAERADVTAAVHVVRFAPTAGQLAAFGRGAALACDHPAYPAETLLGPATLAELVGDLSGT